MNSHQKFNQLGNCDQTIATLISSPLRLTESLRRRVQVLKYKQAFVGRDATRAVATGGVWGCNTPLMIAHMSNYQVNSGRFAEEIEVNQRKFR
jgi:16S rRNA C1402 (ribose-2'-O) methylase RsmI